MQGPLTGSCLGRQTWTPVPESKGINPSVRPFCAADNQNAGDRVFRQAMLDPAGVTEAAGPRAQPATPEAALAEAISYYTKLQCGDGHWAGDYGGPMFLLPGLIITCTVTGLNNRASYRFSVRATNRLGAGAPSAWSSAMVVGTPTAPRAMKVTFPTPGAIRLTWVGPASVGSGAVTRYELRARGHAAGSNVWSAWQPSPTTWGSVGKALAYSDSGAILGATYQFQIRAVNGSGAGPAASLVYVQAT